MKFRLYKGLNKPLIFFGLKEKYIYYAVGIILGTMVLAAVLSNWGMILTVISIAAGGVAIWRLYAIQDKKGLYNKTKTHDQLNVFPKRFNPSVNHHTHRTK